MNVMLGNLTVQDIECRLGIDFPEDIKNFMHSSKQNKASDVKEGMWHCFDIPFHMVCGDAETAHKIYDSLKDQADKVKEPLAFSINSKNNKLSTTSGNAK